MQATFMDMAASFWTSTVLGGDADSSRLAGFLLTKDGPVNGDTSADKTGYTGYISRSDKYSVRCVWDH
jgi:hypothetical protein